MQELIKEIEAAQIKEVTDFNVGDTIKVHAKIVEGNRERIQVFEGLVIKKQGGSNRGPSFIFLKIGIILKPILLQHLL